MSIMAQLRDLYRLTIPPIPGDTHEARLESFYDRHAAYYDATRARSLHEIGRAHV